MARPKHIYLISAARKTWQWSPERRAVIKAAACGPDLVGCRLCGAQMGKNAKGPNGRRLFAVDHVDPIVPPGWEIPTVPPGPHSMSWDTYYERLFFGEQQVLCHPCHKAKTRRERDERKRLSSARIGKRGKGKEG